VAIGIWHNLSSDKMRDAHLDQAPHLRKAWRGAQRRYDAADDATKARLRFERSWLYTLLLDFLNIIHEEKSRPGEFQSTKEKGPLD
jgi:intron-binding protein aquarius